MIHIHSSTCKEVHQLQVGRLDSTASVCGEGEGGVASGGDGFEVSAFRVCVCVGGGGVEVCEVQQILKAQCDSYFSLAMLYYLSAHISRTHCSKVNFFTCMFAYLSPTELSPGQLAHSDMHSNSGRYRGHHNISVHMNTALIS